MAFGNWTGSPGHKCITQTNTPRTLSRQDFGAQNLENMWIYFNTIFTMYFYHRKMSEKYIFKTPHKFHNLLLSSKNDRNNIYWKKNPWKIHVFMSSMWWLEVTVDVWICKGHCNWWHIFNILGLEMTTKKLIHNFLKIKKIIIIKSNKATSVSSSVETEDLDKKEREKSKINKVKL